MSININPNSGKKNSLWLWIAVLALLVGGGMFFFLRSAVNPAIVATNDIKKLLPKGADVIKDINLNEKINSIFNEYPFMSQLVSHLDNSQFVNSTKGKANPFAK
jgi:hypothetical protein